MSLSVSPFARWSLVIPVAIVAIFTIAGALFESPEPQGHAMTHAVPAGILAIAAVGIWRTGAARRRGERLALGALVAMGVAQLLEGISAFVEYPTAGAMHEATATASMLSLVGVVAGIVWALAEAAGASRFQAWAAVAIVGVLGALVMKLLIGGV